MSLFERIKDNPIVAIMIVCSFIVPSTVAVVTYFNKNLQKLDELELRKKLSDQEDKIESLERKVKESKAEYEQLKSKLSSQKVSDELKRKIENLKRGIDNKEDEISGLRDQKDDCLTNYKHCADASERQKGKMASLEKSIESRDSEVARLNDKIEESNKRNAKCVAEVQKQQEAIDELKRESVEGAKKKEKQCADKIAAKDNAITDLKKEIESVKSNSKTGPSFTNSLGMEFRFIKPGSFMMGSPTNEPGRDDDETQHKVTLSKGFYIQTTEVTQGQWKAVMGENPSTFKDCGDDCPVESVSWNVVQEFIKGLNKREGKKYRLPTEAEWEYSCRAETTTPFSFGKCLKTDQANYDGNKPLKGCPKGECRKKTIPVKRFAPNAFGIYDMHGNVWEWCQDWYGEYSSNPKADPTGPSDGFSRVFRGGSRNNSSGDCRSANRNGFAPRFRNNGRGFRLALSPGL